MKRPINSDDWGDIRKEFEETKTSFRLLAKKWGGSRSTIQRKAAEEGWVKFGTPLIKPSSALQPQTKKDMDGIMGDVAIRKIEEIATELSVHYSSVDEPLVMSYAFDYQRMLKLEELVQAEGETCMSPKTGGSYMNPNFSALQAVKSSLAKTAQQLGLSIASRKRIGITLGEDDKTSSLFDFVDVLTGEEDTLDV